MVLDLGDLGQMVGHDECVPGLLERSEEIERLLKRVPDVSRRFPVAWESHRWCPSLVDGHGYRWRRREAPRVYRRHARELNKQNHTFPGQRVVLSVDVDHARAGDRRLIALMALATASANSAASRSNSAVWTPPETPKVASSQPASNSAFWSPSP